MLQQWAAFMLPFLLVDSLIQCAKLFTVDTLSELVSS